MTLRKNISVPEDLYAEFMLLGDEGMSQPEILRTLLSEPEQDCELAVEDIERLQSEAGEGKSPATALTMVLDELVSLRAKCDNYADAVTMLREENDVLQDGIENFGKLGSRTGVIVPGQTAIGDFGGEAVKEAMDAISDVCDDEVACVKTALHLIDKKAEVINNQLDRDHSRNEKVKDRDHIREEKVKDRDHTKEEKEKDRKLKQDLELSRAEHQKKLALIKKGIVDKKDLEDVVFLGSIEKRKTPGEQLAERKKRAYHAANGEDDDFELDGEESVYGESPEDDHD